MKKILLLAIAAGITLGCSKDDGVGAYSISGTPEITSLEVGYKRVIATWDINTTMDDAALTNIYWDGGKSSTGQYLTSDTGNTLTLEITDLAEGEYTFYAQNATPTSNKYSAPSVSVTVYVYGEAYCKALAQRSVTSVDFVEGDADGVGQMINFTWGTAPSSSDCIGTAIYYLNRSGDDATKFCTLSESVSSLEDALVGTEYSTATLYVPDGCIDTLVSTSITGDESLPMGDGPILVGSLKAMIPYFEMDSVHVILDKGDFTITLADVSSGEYLTAYGPNIDEITDSSGNGTGEAKLTENAMHSLFLAKGNNSTYDFGGSTVSIYTTVYQYLGGSIPLRFTGNYNTVKNLEMIDIGEAETTGTGITNITMDGSYNTLESVTLRSTGSYPYRYGEVFGKGFYTIRHDKHCGLLLRGDYNHALNCNIYHYAYGHCVFMQAAENPTIEGCYIEAEVSTTSSIWAEKGTDSPADQIDFLTAWGFFLNEDFKFTMALSEEGIRAYGSGETVINGKGYIRGGALNPRIINNTIKNARAGVTLTHAAGTRYVYGCTAIGCERGFAIGTGEIIDCYSDAQFGPAFGVDYSWDSGVTADITLIDGTSADYVTVEGVDYPTCNGGGQIAYIQGSNHELKFRDGRGSNSPEIVTWVQGMVSSIPNVARIQLGGSLHNIGELWEPEYDLSNYNFDWILVPTEYLGKKVLQDEQMPLTYTKVANETDWVIYIDENVSNCEIYSNGSIWMEPGAKNNKVYTSGSIITYGSGDIDSSNTLQEGYSWDIDSCF